MFWRRWLNLETHSRVFNMNFRHVSWNKKPAQVSSFKYSLAGNDFCPQFIVVVNYLDRHLTFPSLVPFVKSHAWQQRIGLWAHSFPLFTHQAHAQQKNEVILKCHRTGIKSSHLKNMHHGQNKVTGWGAVDRIQLSDTQYCNFYFLFIHFNGKAKMYLIL